jgi:hypothetical protein
MNPRLAVALRAATALVLATALPTFAASAPRGHTHRAVAGEQDCVPCHQSMSPGVVAAWEESPHGLALVKCLVCHGSTGADFRAKPDTSGCRGCHAAQVESVASRATRDCFACHAPHTLSPTPHH